MTSLATPQHYHNTLADVNPNARPGMESDVPGAAGYRQSERELVAYEKGRIQGDIEATRRMEVEGGTQLKTFAPALDERTIINQNLAQATVVELQPFTLIQWGAAIFGEVCSVAYITMMGIWIDAYRGGLDWADSEIGSDANHGMFNVHVLTAFLGLWFASQAYLLYRILPIHTNTVLNKVLYVTLHALALASFGVCMSAAIKSQPAGTNVLSMHAWTSIFALVIYFAHVVYSSLRLLTTPEVGIEAHEWNETHNTSAAQAMAAYPAATIAPPLAPMPVLYREGPTHSQINERANAAAAAAQSSTATVPTASPVWTENPAYTANNFFLVPRAKWAVCSLLGLGASVLVGLGQQQTLLAAGGQDWAQEGVANRNGVLNTQGPESYIIGAIGLATMGATLAIAYAAMPPRTVVAKAALPAPAGRRLSMSLADTQPNTRIGTDHELHEMHEDVQPVHADHVV